MMGPLQHTDGTEPETQDHTASVLFFKAARNDSAHLLCHRVITVAAVHHRMRGFSQIDMASDSVAVAESGCRTAFFAE